MKKFIKSIYVISFSLLVASCSKDGCTDPTATNYNPDATSDDNSCVILGCTDPNAINYNPDATCLLYTSPSPRDRQKSRMPSSA